MPKVNGHPASIGCYIDSHHGQYAPDRLQHIFTMFDIPFSGDDCPVYWREQAENADNADERGAFWDSYFDSVDNMDYLLNSLTDAEHLWVWEDGEFWLLPMFDVTDQPAAAFPHRVLA